MMNINGKVTPINDNGNSCHITAVELVCMGSISCKIMPPVINSLGGGHTHSNTHAHTNRHTDDPHRINFKTPHAPAKPGLKIS